MTNIQIYATVGEVVADLEWDGVKDPDRALAFIKAASQVIHKRGNFIPVNQTRTYDGEGKSTLWIDPLLSVTTLTYNGVALNPADYSLQPFDRFWDDGPRTSIELVNEGVWSDDLSNIVIAGVWGMYLKTVATVARSSQATTESVELVVDNGGPVSPGMIVLIDSEYEVVESINSPIDSTAVLENALDDAPSIFDVDTGTLLHVGEIIRIDFEQMIILDILADTLLVARGYNGTTRADHVDASKVYVYRSFRVVRGINGTTAAVHSDDVIYQVAPPADVNYLCRQIAGLMLKKAKGGWAGKTGNVELGEVFYNNEFPQDQIDRVMNNYRIVTI